MVLQGEGLALTGVRTVFIDDGGVLNDNTSRGEQYRRLLGEYLAPRLGGTPDAWSAANVAAFERSWARYVAHIKHAGDVPGIDRWIRDDRTEWLKDMCHLVGVDAPRDPEAYAIETSVWVAERVRAAVPGAVDVVRWLSSRGLVLHTATGALSWEIEPYLVGMGIRGDFDRLYGPDLVDTYKNGPHFHRALLADSHTDPRLAVLVDDSAEVRSWARVCGLRTFASLAELRAALG